MHHFIKGLLHQRRQNQRGQNGYTLNPVKFSLNCFLAALFERSRPVGSLYFQSRRGVGAAAPIQMRLRGCVYVNAPGGEGDES